jgi:class 3 adenylate cyclase/tetratricopeptide (TPR) repeat protein
VADTLTCGGCGTELPAGAKFCGECGTPQALACPGCGGPVNPSQKFCLECGTPLAGGTAAAPAPPAAAAPTAGRPERRLVTVLFADLVSFTTLSEHRDPEVVRDMLEQYFERCRTIIARYGGVVQKFIGDAVMAVWGTPVAREDDAERAVRAALELTGAVTALGGEIGMPELRVRAGLLTGETAVNVGAEHEGMVIGDAVNTASRIQSLAEPETVFVEDATRRATQAAIAYEEAGTHQVKGRDQPVRVWKALRVIAGVGGSGRGSGLEAPFVGRDAELRAVTLAGERVIQQHRAELVTVLGDAGMGKSRLAWEFEKKVDGIADDVFWHRGRCLSYGEGVSFWALAEVVRMRADIPENEPAATAREKLRATVEEFITDERERKLVLPRLEHLLGLAETGADPGDLFSGWRLFFERLAAVNPVVLVFEDLQWADTGLLEFIDHLVEWASESPILILALARPEVCERRPGWAADAHRLQPLDGDAMRDLLAGLVPGLPDTAVKRIRERAEGIPLYAVETVRMMLDRGVLAQEDDVYVVTGDVDDVQVPETLHALVASRLDNLTPVERKLIQDASVLGATFVPDGLAALSELPMHEVQPALDGLVAKQILEVEHDPRSPERGQYGFVQALLKTVAYGTLGRRGRKARHLKVAEYLERAWRDGAEDYAEVLATHYVEAVRAEPDAADAAELRAKAGATLTEAGRRAMSFGLGAEARRWFERAAEMAAESLQQAELLDLAGRGAALSGDAETLELFEQAASRLDALGEPRRAAMVRARTAEFMIDTARAPEGAELLARLLEVLGTDVVDADVAFVSSELARAAMFTGNAEAGLAHIDLALRYAEREADLELVATSLVTRGTLCDIVGRPQEALALLRHAIAMAGEHHFNGVAGRGLGNLFYPLMRTGRLEACLDAATEAVQLFELVGHRPRLMSTLGIRVGALISLGQWEAAFRDLDRLEGDYRALGYAAAVQAFVARGDAARLAKTEALINALAGQLDPEDQSTLDAALALIALTRSEHEAGLKFGAEAVEAMFDAASVPFALFALLDVAIAAGRPDIGEQAVQRTLAQGAAYASPALTAHVCAFRGRAARDAGDPETAARELRRAVAGFRETELPLELGRALQDLGELEGNAELRDEAQAIFARLGATAYVDAPLPA